MRLYHFTTAEHGLAAIRDQRLKIAEIDKLNDPFEFLGFELSNRQTRAFIKTAKKEIAKDWGLLCLSRRWTHPLMWSHYADKHQGLCLGFDINAECNKIDYQENRLKTSNLKSAWENPPTKDNLKEVVNSFYYKFKAWEYEDEYRLLCRKINKDPISNLFFQKCTQEIILREIFVGSESKVTRWQIGQVLGDQQPSVQVAKVRPAFKTFDIVKDKRQSAWR